MASAVGATVVSTSSEDSKLEIARQLGATHLINYRTHQEWSQEVLRLTGGKGVDHVVDVGGAGTIEQSIQSTRQGGLISLVGVLASSTASDIVPSLIYGGKTGTYISFVLKTYRELTKCSTRHFREQRRYERAPCSNYPKV